MRSPEPGLPGSTGVPRRCSVWTQRRFSSMVWTGCQRIFLRCQLPRLSRTAACAGSEVPPPIPGCAAGPGCDGRPDPSAFRRLQPAAQGVDANANVSGNLLGPPLLSNRPYRAGLEGLIIARRRRPFFSSASVPYACPFPFHSFLYCCLFCPSIRAWRHPLCGRAIGSERQKVSQTQ